MPEFLLEVGCEELPATFVRKAFSDLAESLESGLRDAGIIDSSSVITKMGTPRRLIVGITGIIERQEAKVKEMRGPSLKAAYDADGNPTGALVGFCRGNGIEISSLRKDEQYVWADKPVTGRSALDILSEVVPAAIRSLTFEKTMRWGSGRMRFARPIRWILASLDGQAVNFEVEGVRAGLESRGHRFYNPETFHASDFGDLVLKLRERFVEPDPAVRRQRILDEAPQVADGEPQLPDSLVEENVFLTEWPTAVAGRFRPEFQVLPDAVLVTAMAKHEKMFPVKTDGKLTNQFVFIRNSGDNETVRRGNEWVLNARFNDAKFFFDEDQKHSLDDFLAKTEHIVFQEKLGTVRARSSRLENLSRGIADIFGLSVEQIETASTAGLYAKADLSTGLVSELASLQGVIGGEYAARAGLSDEVSEAIRTQYDPERASAPTSVVLIMADQLDKLAGYLGLVLAPTGSSDPFGLRRAVTILIDLAWKWPSRLPDYSSLLTLALTQYGEQGVRLDSDAAQASLGDLFTARYSALLPFRHDILAAAALSGDLSEVTAPRNVRVRAGILFNLIGETSLVQACTRPLNIVAAAKKKGISINGVLAPRDVESVEGERLFQVLSGNEARLAHAIQEEDSNQITDIVRSLRDPINAFFDSTMIMVDDVKVRDARLSLLQRACSQILAIGDVSRLEG
jgi:glycyl-tRNA synthetase beta chain